MSSVASVTACSRPRASLRSSSVLSRPTNKSRWVHSLKLSQFEEDEEYFFLQLLFLCSVICIISTSFENESLACTYVEIYIVIFAR